MVHATWAAVASNSVWKVFRATETTVMSRIDMIAPSTTTPATRRTPRSSLSEAWAGSCAGFGDCCSSIFWLTERVYETNETDRTRIGVTVVTGSTGNTRTVEDAAH